MGMPLAHTATAVTPNTTTRFLVWNGDAGSVGYVNLGDGAPNLTAVVATAATSSTPFGYSQAQADAIVAQLNLIITWLIAKGFAT